MQQSNKKQQTLRCAFACLGRIASLLENDKLREKPCTYAGAVYENTECVISGGFDISEKRRNKFSQNWKCPVFDSMGKMIQSVKPHILFVATPPESHLEIVEKVAKQGIKTIVCEKPLADTLESAKILTSHERRYANNYFAVKK